MDLFQFQIRISVGIHGPPTFLAVESLQDLNSSEIKNEKMIPGDRKAHHENQLQVQCQN